MAKQTERTYVGQIAGAAPFDDGNDVVGIPKRPAVQCSQAPVCQQPQSSGSALPPDLIERGHGVHAANRAHAAVTFEGAFPQVAGICPQTPFFNTEIRAEGPPPDRHFKTAPATESAPIVARGKLARFDSTAPQLAKPGFFFHFWTE
jgi:hypothetical protein